MLKILLLSLNLIPCFGNQFHIHLAQYKAATRAIFTEYHKELQELKNLHHEHGATQAVMLRAGSFFKEYTRLFLGMRGIDIYVQQEIQNSLHALIPFADRVFEKALTEYIDQLNKKESSYDKTNVRPIACKAK